MEQNTAVDIKVQDVYEASPIEGLMPSSQPDDFIVFPWGEITNKNIIIFVEMSALINIYRHAKSSPQKEVGGFLVGYPMQEKETLFVLITDATHAQHAHSMGEALSFTHQTWKMLDCQMGERFKDKYVVGWYHTHPGLGLFMSHYDSFIHNNFFSLPWQLALVVDPATENHMFFQKKNNRLAESGYYFYTEKTKENAASLKKMIDRLVVAQKRERSGRYKRYSMAV
ncbi:MAG: Mov34/MPN/PAD-1 family protein [Candidatus Desantisbacteria bacterium]